ncbi:MAG: serine hydrolase [Acidobacteriota bacterium]
MTATTLFDALLISSALGSILVLVARWVLDRSTSSSHPRLYQIALGALLCNLGMLLALVTIAPAPGGSLAPDTGSGGWDAASLRPHSFAAMGKFEDTEAELASARRAPTPPWMLGALALWGLGFMGLLARSAARRLRTSRVIARAGTIQAPALVRTVEGLCQQLGLRQTPRLLRHEAIDVPMAGGVLRPVIFLPASLERQPAAHVELVLLHELAHLHRRDPFASLVIEGITACFWFNPLVWRAARELRELQELATDSQVLSAGIQPSRYASCLLEMYRAFSGQAFSGRDGTVGRPVAPQPSLLPGTHSIIGSSLIETRLRRVLDTERSHHAPRRSWTLGLVATGVALCLATALAPQALSQSAAVEPEAESSDGAPLLDTSILHRAALDELLRPIFIDTMAERHIAGAAIAIVHNGRLIYDQGFGHQEVYHQRPVDARRTIFRIGSISKVMTGVAVMQLVDRGLIDLDADVNIYLTDLKVPETFDEPVRVRHLLTHTAGFDQIGLGRHVARPEDVVSLREFLDGNLIRLRPPGELSCYDTYAITLAGYLVEVVSGLSYEQYLIQNLFRPLEMYRSGIAIPKPLAVDAAVGYIFNGSWNPMPWEHMNTGPASTVNSTAVDMANFAVMMLQGGSFKGQQILSPESARAMLTRQYTNHPDHPGYGLTFFEDPSHGVDAFGHGGSMEGFGAYLYLAPELDLGVYFAHNQESGALPDAALSRLMAALLPEHETGPKLRPRVSEAIDFTRFAGTYANNIFHHTDPTTGWVPRPREIQATEDGLLYRDQPVVPVGPLQFQREDGLLLTFREDAKGEITHFFIQQAVYERLAP